MVNDEPSASGLFYQDSNFLQVGRTNIALGGTNPFKRINYSILLNTIDLVSDPNGLYNILDSSYFPSNNNFSHTYSLGSTALKLAKSSKKFYPFESVTSSFRFSQILNTLLPQANTQ